jgi:hypothetical protein
MFAGAEALKLISVKIDDGKFLLNVTKVKVRKLNKFMEDLSTEMEEDHEQLPENPRQVIEEQLLKEYPEYIDNISKIYSDYTQRIMNILEFGSSCKNSCGSSCDYSDETNFGNKPPSRMNNRELFQHTVNKFGSSYANKMKAQKYTNSMGVKTIKYVKR